MNALENIKNLPLTKSEQADFAQQCIEEITGGFVDAVQADMRLKALEEVIKQIRDHAGVKNMVLDEAEKYGKSATVAGVKFQIKTRTTRDFTGCGDAVYNGLVSDLEKTKASIKAREAMLNTGVDPGTGETFAPPVTSTTTFISYTF